MAKSLNTTQFINAIHDKNTIKGYTHNFYNYPARFSPAFVREAIKAFTQEDDLIIDPFVGGGTTLVEAKLLKRNSIGLDISSLATFISKTKTTPLNYKDINLIKKWAQQNIEDLGKGFSSDVNSYWQENGYHSNVNDKSTWRIRNVIEHFLFKLENSTLSKKQQNFLRCSILKTGQWALDNKKVLPNTNEFKIKISSNIEGMTFGAIEFYESIVHNSKNTRCLCINKSSFEIENLKIIKQFQPPKLIITSPPYPGVHIVYHRWQIKGRKETPAPFWIADSLDGHGISHYTMGGRSEKGIGNYFENIFKSFSSIKKICSEDTIIVQMLAFSDIATQLPIYLNMMTLSGFNEIKISPERIWRNVPNRKWYSGYKKNCQSSREVVLFHKLI